MQRIFVEDLIPVAYYNAKDVLFALKTDIEREADRPLFVMRVWIDGEGAYGFGLGEKFMKFLHMDIINLNDTVLTSFLLDRIGQKFNGYFIYQMMTDFQREREEMLKMENPWSYNFTPVKEGISQTGNDKPPTELKLNTNES